MVTVSKITRFPPDIPILLHFLEEIKVFLGEGLGMGDSTLDCARERNLERNDYQTAFATGAFDEAWLP
jgi:hypothetical protein